MQGLQPEQESPEIQYIYDLVPVHSHADGQFNIPYESTLVFLAENDIEISGSFEVLACIQKVLQRTMSLEECTVLAEYNLKSLQCGAALSAPALLGKLSPDDVAVNLKMDLSYNDDYLADPKGFEDRLKDHIAEALVMQNLQSLEESSNFKVQLKRLFAQHIHIVDISNGCIETVIILGGLTFLAMAFVASLRMGKRFKVSARFSGTVVAAEIEV